MPSIIVLTTDIRVFFLSIQRFSDVRLNGIVFPRTILLVSFLACFALHASTGAGQTVGAMTGAITGTVTDRTSAGLPGITIAISSAALMGTRATVTNVLNANPEQNTNWSSGPSVLRPLSIVPPRLSRIGVKLEW